MVSLEGMDGQDHQERRHDGRRGDTVTVGRIVLSYSAADGADYALRLGSAKIVATLLPLAERDNNLREGELL